jgi:thiamine pyrophosphokinase
VVVIAGTGERLDHLVGALLLLGSEKWAGVELDAVVGAARIHVVRRERELAGRTGELVSLLPVHGPASGVTTMGLEFELRGETLEPGSSRGVSNVFVRDTARVSVGEGVLLAVRPHALDPPRGRAS